MWFIGTNIAPRVESSDSEHSSFDSEDDSYDEDSSRDEDEDLEDVNISNNQDSKEDSM